MTNSMMDQLIESAIDNEVLPPFMVTSIQASGQMGFMHNLLLQHPAANTLDQEVVILAFLIDDSGSMGDPLRDDPSMPRYKAVAPVHNLVISELRTTKLSDAVLVYTEALNGGVLNAFCALQDAVDLDDTNYGPNGGTPLYDRTHRFYTSLMLKATEFLALSRQVRIISLVITDGQNQGRHTMSAADCKLLLSDLLNLNSEKAVPLVAIGVALNDANDTSYDQVLTEMGFKDVRGYKLDRASIKAFCNTVSQSMIRASQSAANFAAMQNNPFATP